MTRSIRAPGSCWPAWSLCLRVGCARRGEPVATLIDTQGTVERNDGSQAWTVRRAGVRVRRGRHPARPPRTRRRACGSTNGTVIRVLENARIRFARGTLPNAKGAERERRARFGGGRIGDRRDRAGDGARRRAHRARRPGAGFVGRRARDAGGRRRAGGAARVPDGELVVDAGQGRKIASGDSRPELYEVEIGAADRRGGAAAGAAPRRRAARAEPRATRRRRRPPRPEGEAGRARRTAART